MESDTTKQKAIIKDFRKYLSRINVILETKLNGDCVNTLWQTKNKYNIPTVIKKMKHVPFKSLRINDMKRYMIS